MATLPISISIVALNEEANLPRCLSSIEGLCEEIVIVDAGSTDSTREIAEKYGARFIHQDWLGYRDQKNVALEACTSDWVLALDCDEEVSPQLRESIESFFKNRDDEKYVGAWFNRKVWFLGRWITHGDWYPDRKLRLFRRNGARWGGSPEHDKIEIEGQTTRLKGDLHHFSFPTTNRYIEKINTFSDVFLERQLDSGKRWSLLTTLFRPYWRFFRAYILRRGFLDGFPGYWIARATAFSAFVRYSRTYEYKVKDRTPNGSPGGPEA